MPNNFSALNRYTRWDGTQKRPAINADAIMDALSDSLMEYGDLEYSLESLMRHGFNNQDSDKNGESLKGIFEYIRKLREKRREQLQKYNLDSAIDGIKEKLDKVIQMEKETIEEWVSSNSPEKPGDTKFSDKVLGDIGNRNKDFINGLPDDLAGKVKFLEKYEFLNTDAQKIFLEILKQLREAMSATFFKDVEKMLKSMSDDDIERMKEMLKALNELIVKHITEKDPYIDQQRFDFFMGQYGDMFGDPQPKNIDELLAQMRQQMSASQSLMNSLSPDQQQQLQELFGLQLGDADLQHELNQLAKELSFLNPNGIQRPFSGDEEIDLKSAMDLMSELDAMDKLESDLARTRQFPDLDKLNQDDLKKFLGEDAADSINDLKNILDELKQAGYINKNGNKWDVTARGSRKIGQSALGEIYKKLKNQNMGSHRTPKDGKFGDRQEDSKSFEFGDGFDLHVPRTIRNSLVRNGRREGKAKVELGAEDFEVYRNEKNTRTATVLLLDLSWSMAMRGYFLPAKKVAIALEQLIKSSYPGDTFKMVGFSALASEIKSNELPLVNIDEFNLGTNMQHALLMAEAILDKEKSASKQIIMISDGEPTSHIENGLPFFQYPPVQKTIDETFKAVARCTRKKIPINTFMLENNPFLRAFMDKVTKMNGGRVFFTSPHRLGEYILHDYVDGKKKRVV